MLEIGQFFEKEDGEYGLLDKLVYEGKKYLFFSVEADGKVDYRFYTVESFDDTEGYSLALVEDEILFMELMEAESNRIDLNKDIDIPNVEMETEEDENTSVD